MRNKIWMLDNPVGFPYAGVLYDPATIATTVAANVIGSAISGDASKSAANTESDAAKYSANLQDQELQQMRQTMQPFVQSGSFANQRLMSLLGVGPHNLTDPSFGSLTQPFTADTFRQYQDPGYQFQLQQGQQALQNSQAAQNGVLSGAALKDLIGFNQGMASNAYSNAFDRYMASNDATYQRLAGLLGIGENAAAGVGNAGIQTGANIGNTIMGGASAQAAGTIGQANAVNGGINNALGYYMLSKMPGFGGGSSSYGGQLGGLLSNNADLMNSQNMTPADLMSAG